VSSLVRFFLILNYYCFIGAFGPGGYLRDRQKDKGVLTTPLKAPGLPAPFINYLPNMVLIRKADTKEDLIAEGDPNGGGLKELDEKLKNRIDNLKDMVLYRFGSTGVVQVLSRAAELLGLVPVFPVRNVSSFGSGASGSNAVFRDCVLVKNNTTVAEVARKVMGDAPLAYVEGAGGVRVAEDDFVAIGKNDVSMALFQAYMNTPDSTSQILSFKVGRA
jgi:hypothetical protein